MVPRIGIVSNPRSSSHRAGSAGLAEAAARLPHASPENREALRAALARFASDGVEMLVVHGGDGTLREVLTALPQAWRGAPPAIAPLPAGRTNLAAHTLGLAGTGREDPTGLMRLLAAAGAGRLRRQSRPVLEISGATDLPMRGFLFGAAAFTRAVGLAEGRLHRHGLMDNAVVGMTGVMMAIQALAGRGAFGRALRRGTEMKVGCDNDAAVAGPRFILLATTLDRLMLGLWPFWGQGEGAIRLLDVAAPPQRLGAGLWSLLRRRPPVLPGWHSRRVDRLQLTFTDAFVLDGETFQPGPAGIRLSATAPLTFVAA